METLNAFHWLKFIKCSDVCCKSDQIGHCQDIVSGHLLISWVYGVGSRTGFKEMVQCMCESLLITTASYVYTFICEQYIYQCVWCVVWWCVVWCGGVWCGGVWCGGVLTSCLFSSCDILVFALIYRHCHVMWSLSCVLHGHVICMSCDLPVMCCVMWSVCHVICMSCVLHVMWSACHVICLSCDLPVMWSVCHVILCHVICMSCDLPVMCSVCHVICMSCNLPVMWSACHVICLFCFSSAEECQQWIDVSNWTTSRAI